jgi:virulence-associated protein VagC
MARAKLFITGGSQAVRLPAEFRFEGSEVDIRRDPVTQDVVLQSPGDRGTTVLIGWERGGCFAIAPASGDAQP